MEALIRLVAGLGNPGSDYQGHRHNAGADFVCSLACRAGVELLSRTRFHSRMVNLPESRVRLMVPTTYMNESGIAVSAVLGYYRLLPETLLVVHDELDLPPGEVRIKKGGGTGGHRGLKDIVSHLGGRADFWRLRIGVGHPRENPRMSGTRVDKYLLSRASEEEQACIDAASSAALDSFDQLLAGDSASVMNRLHRRSFACTKAFEQE